MPTSLRFALTGTGQQFVACAELLLERGHSIVGLLSDCPEVSAWATRRGIARTSPATAGPSWLPAEPFDYLVSVINHAIVSPALLAAPIKGAVNYHDSPLPSYGGFNATAWAIIDGHTGHGVTWHRMTADVDAGDVLIQEPIEISSDDTAFTLGVKCSETGVEMFAVLVELMEKGSPESRPQRGEGNFHFRSDRPGVAVLDFSRPASELHALVRGLTFGPEDNWMARPKVAVPGAFLVVGETRLDPRSEAKGGTVVSITKRAISVAAKDGVLALSDLATLDGTPIDCLDAAKRFGIVEGLELPRFDAAASNTIDQAITKSERFWVKRLSTLQPAMLPGLEARGEKRPRVIQRTLHGVPKDRRNAVLVAALAAYVKRLGETGDSAFDVGLRAPLATELAPFYAPVVPLRFDVSSSATFASLVSDAAAELATQAKRQTYARDAVQRYASLRNRKSFALPIGVSLDGADLAGDTRLMLVTSHGDGYAWVFDESSLSHEAATALADRFDVLLTAALANEDTAVSALPLLPRAERDLLLSTWQNTARPYDASVCVHQFFERQAERAPNAKAVVFGGAELTYRELNERANQLAHVLRGKGVGPETLVGICVERSVDMLVGLLGILKAGGAYVPLDPAYPRERLAMMLEDSKTRLVVTQRAVADKLPPTSAELVFVDAINGGAKENPSSSVTAENLAYVIFTSGSTGRPKGTMIEHRNVANFFAGMDDTVGAEKAGVWLAVTSISFDISVLELFWTLARGFTVVIAPEIDRASIERKERTPVSKTPMEFGLFYFAADSGATSPGNAYRLLIEGAKFADTRDFAAVWTPERHFHAFGGLYPNPAVTTAAIATITKRVHLRAGSVVLPLHNPLRVAEDWAVIDQLSNGRIGLSFASGWHVNDFTFMPDAYERRREVMLEHIETIYKLWRGEKVPAKNGAGQTIEVSVLPRPVQARPPLWIASAGTAETFILAGKLGANVLTNMLGQDIDDLRKKFAAYRDARREAGHEGPGTISVMLHTFVCDSDEKARRLAKKPFSDYLASSFDLVKVAPKMFPAFRQPSKGASEHAAVDSSGFTPEDMQALLEHAFDRYFETAGLFGTPERALEMIDQLQSIGATEIACLIDFGIDPEIVLESLPHLHRLQELCRSRAAAASSEAADAHPGIGELIRRHHVTHLQCTPSMARMLVADDNSLSALAQLDRLLLGGEALPSDLAERVAKTVKGKVLNMYGPTETTVWSTTSVVAGGSVTIGRPIANTTIRILDANRQPIPVGTPGELFIGGDGVVRGYLDRAELTAERFVDDLWAKGRKMYRTGDLARYRGDGEIEFLGRLDHQVKVSGYRIELGEIETALARHASVGQSVVVARASNGTPSLVAYVVAAKGASSSDDDRVRDWRNVWDETYAAGRNGNGVDPRFRIAGWNDSFTGEPIPAAEMREWLDRTVERIVALRPKRVLEIGCGTGLILYRVVPHVEHYTGVDLSPEALDSIRRELTPAESARVTLVEAPAHAIAGIADRSFDTVVINSVAQYFPDADYLARVLRRASELVADGGRIFVGDVRSLAHLEAFHAEMRHHEPERSEGEGSALATGERKESELVLAEAFFHALARQTPRISAVDVQLKRGAARNEMSRYRYDVVLSVGGAVARWNGGTAERWNGETVGRIQERLAAAPDSVAIADIPNARLTDDGIDPEALYAIDAPYSVHIRWASSGDPSRFDVVLQRNTSAAKPMWPFEPPRHDGNLADYANTPVRADTTLATTLRAHLRRSLPEYMVPATFVVLDALPLTPNGKIDRKALPEPEQRAAAMNTQYVAPTSDLEQQIADIWRELLAVERVGRQDNIFDLGANSLLTMQANTRLSTVLGRKVSLVSMFRYPTVESLASHLGENGHSPGAKAPEKKAQERANRAEQAAERRRALRAERKDR